jgi:hypothetical protein
MPASGGALPSYLCREQWHHEQCDNPVPARSCTFLLR